VSLIKLLYLEKITKEKEKDMEEAVPSAMQYAARR
jgi:hypothetical protein